MKKILFNNYILNYSFLIFKLIKKFYHNKKIIIAGYYPSNYEVDILRFLEEASKKNFKVVLPVIISSSRMSFKLWNYGDPLYVSKFGTLEPQKSKKDIIPDLIIVPLVAFDKELNRLGYGGGFYDRYIQKISKIKKVVKVGLAFSFQKLKTIPVNKHDKKLDIIITEKEII